MGVENPRNLDFGYSKCIIMDHFPLAFWILSKVEKAHVTLNKGK